MNHISGPMGGPRPFSRCTVTMNFEIDRKLSDAVSDVDSVLDKIEQLSDAESVTTRNSRFKGIQEIVVADDNDILREREQRQFERAVNSALVDTVQIVGSYISTL